MSLTTNVNEVKEKEKSKSKFLEELEKSASNGSKDFIRYIAERHEPSTERNRRRRESVFTTPFTICVERARYFTESYKETEGELPLLRMARAFRNYLQNVTLVLDENDLFAAYAGGKLRCSQVWPELSSSYLDNENAFAEVSDFHINKVHINDEEIAELKEIGKYWRGKSVQDVSSNLMLSNDESLYNHGLIFSKNMIAGIGHFTVDVKRVITRGLKDIREEALAKAKALEEHPEDGLTPKKIAFYKAAAIALEGVIIFARRWAEYAGQLASEEVDELRRSEFQRIADACARVPEHPARTFFEGLQAMQIVVNANMMESCHISITPGRLDQTLYPLYRKDIDAGTLTRDEAVEFIENFMLRIGQNSWLYTASQETALFYPQKGELFNITLSGKDRDGNDQTNELTYLFMHAHSNISLGHPSLSLRIHRNTPDELWEACARVVGRGKGQPALMNDEVMIPALMRLGLEEQDAYNYANIGCIEMGAAGTSIGPVSIGFVNLAKCLELALHNGRCSLMGDQVGPETGDARTFTSYEQLFNAYKEQVRFAMTCFNHSVSAIEIAHELLRPIPFMSSITDNSMECGLDQTNGGSKYYQAGIEGVGVADVGDSLAAVKKLVFDEKKLTMAELLDALSSNFAEKEPLRQILLNGAPKFGNDDDFVDEITRESCTVFLEEVKNHRDYWGSEYYPGIWSIQLAFLWGYVVGALPCGRFASTSLTEGVAPCRGCDRNGPTATVKSVAKLDHHLMQNGSIFNMKFNPDMFEDASIGKFIDLAKTYLNLGGFQMQFTVVDRETLLDAQEHPENYRDLIVRVAGYSAYFIEQTKQIQDHIIERTEFC